MYIIGVILSLMGFVFYGGLFVWFKRFYIRSLTPPYTAHDLLDISNKSVSASHAILSTIAGLIITTNIGDDIKFETVWITNTFAWFGFPYFVYDLWCMFHVFRHLPVNEGLNLFRQLNTFVTANPIMIIHHIVLFFVAFPLTVHYRRNMGDYFIGCFYLAELSTPFVSARAIMSKRGMKSSFLYVINGILMMVTFFLCRVCTFPYLYYTYSVYANIPIFKVFFSIPKKCNVGSLIFFVMQLHWFIVMTRGALKLFTRQSTVTYSQIELVENNVSRKSQ